MQKIYSHPNLSIVHLVKNELEQRGIESAIQGEHLASIIGGGAGIEAWYELWLLDEARLPEATAIVQEIIDHANDEEDDASETEPWTCPNCGEQVDSEFAVCWNCGHQRVSGR